MAKMVVQRGGIAFKRTEEEKRISRLKKELEFEIKRAKKLCEELEKEKAELIELKESFMKNKN